MNSNRLDTRIEGERHNIATEREPLIKSLQPGYSGTSEIRERRSRTRSPTLYTQQYHSDQEIYNVDRSQNHRAMSRPTRLNTAKTSDLSEIPSLGRVPPSYGDDGDGEVDASYEMYTDNDNLNRPVRSIRSIKSAKSHRDSRFGRTFSDGRNPTSSRTNGDKLHQYYNDHANRIFSEQPSKPDEPINGVSDEILAVRRSALTVYEPLTYTWVSR